MVDEIKEIMSSVLGIETNSIDGETSSLNVIEWDSLKHMNLVFALEDRLDIKFSNEEIVKLMSYKAIVSCVEKKLEKSFQKDSYI